MKNNCLLIRAICLKKIIKNMEDLKSFVLMGSKRIRGTKRPFHYRNAPFDQ
jgi:hypothetical protein